MKKLYFLKGLPGSGKSTWAKKKQADEPNTVRVNKDELRSMFHNGVHSKGREAYILEIRNYSVMKALEQGHNVIVDDTNFNPVHETDMRVAAKLTGAEFEIVDMRSSIEPESSYLERCIANDLKRSKSVGESVIRQMFNQYIRKAGIPSKQIDFIGGLEVAVICDLDGTLCLFGDKNPYDRDFENDIPNKAVLDILERIDICNFEGFGENTKLIFMSGRSAKHFEVTRKWLDDLGFRIYPLFMRSEGDTRKDFVVKQELYEKNVKGKYNVSFVLDDRNQVVNLWRDLGLTCFQVAPGDF